MNGIDTDNVPGINNSWINNIVNQLPKDLVVAHPHLMESLIMELREDYVLNVKKAIGRPSCHRSKLSS